MSFGIQKNLNVPKISILGKIWNVMPNYVFQHWNVRF